MGDYNRDLPSPCEILLAMDWVRAGCPAYPTHIFGERRDPKTAIDIIHRLLENLPAHHPQYCHGTPEFWAAMKACQKDAEVEKPCYHETDKIRAAERAAKDAAEVEEMMRKRAAKEAAEE